MDSLDFYVMLYSIERKKCNLFASETKLYNILKNNIK